jgi:hypothetical protein
VVEPVAHAEMMAGFLKRLATIESFLTDRVSMPGHLVRQLSVRHHREQSFERSRLSARPALEYG